MALSCKAVLKVLLTVRCYPCGCGIVCPSYAYAGLSLFIIRWANVYLVVCVLTRITLQMLTKASDGMELLASFKRTFTGGINQLIRIILESLISQILLVTFSICF